MNKKGHILSDMFIFMIGAFILVLAVVILVYASTVTYNHLITNAAVFQKVLPSTSNATTIIQDTFGQVPNAYQTLRWITVMLIFGMMISTIIAAYMVRVSPVYFVAYLLVWLIAIILSASLSNVFHTVYTNPLLSPTFTGFWSVNIIFENLPIWITAIGAISAILMIVNMIKADGNNSYG